MTEPALSPNSRRIFIISTHSMFGHGLKKLLQQQPRFDVVGLETNIEQALVQISKETELDVIIVENNKSPSSRLTGVISHLLRENLGKTIISLNLQSNELLIFVTAHWLVTDTDDLVLAIQQEIPVDLPPQFE